MKNLKWPFQILLILFSVNTAYSQYPKYELRNTEVITFNSVLDTQKFVLNILLPDDYAETKKKYPVLYVTDGQWCFNLAVAAYRHQNYDGFVPDLIIVGIAWTDNYMARRTRDFTPTHLDSEPNSGNAPKFLAVIKNEIITLIESKYRVEKSDKALYGLSDGGLFAIYTLFHDPTLFNRYIIVSPNLIWDNEIVFKYEKQFAEKNKTLNAKIFVSSGEYEEAYFPGNRFNRFNDQLKASKYKGMEVETIVLDKLGHASSATTGLIRGMQFVYRKPELKLDSGLLDQYSGHFVSGKDTTLVIRTGDSIHIILPSGAKAPLNAETDQNFYIKGYYFLVQFKRDNSKKVMGYDLNLHDTTLFYKRIDLRER